MKKVFTFAALMLIGQGLAWASPETVITVYNNNQKDVLFRGRVRLLVVNTNGITVPCDLVSPASQIALLILAGTSGEFQFKLLNPTTCQGVPRAIESTAYVSNDTQAIAQEYNYLFRPLVDGPNTVLRLYVNVTENFEVVLAPVPVSRSLPPIDRGPINRGR